MLPCLILGDSIAVGIAAALVAMHQPACEVQARSGASVRAITSMVPSIGYRVILVSAGSNDATSASLSQDLERLRARLRGARVAWIYPRSPRVAWSVFAVARRNGDQTIGIAGLRSTDGIHPIDYKAAARAIVAPRAPPSSSVRRAGATVATNR